MSEKRHKTKIGHSLQQLQDGLILTLQDKPVLLNGQINQDDDVFQNYEKRVQNEAQHNRQLKQKLKTIANAATSHLQSKNQGGKGLLPHYDDHRYKSDQIDLEDGAVTKRSRPKVSKNIANDFISQSNTNTEYYQRGNKFKQRKKQKNNTADLLSFLNETAVQKQVDAENDNHQASDIIEQSLNTVRKKMKLEADVGSISNQIQNNEDQELLAKAIKLTRQKNQQQTKLLDMIKQQDQQNVQGKQKCIQIQMKPVNYKINNAAQQAKKVYNVTDAAKGTTSCLFINLPSQKITIKKQEKQQANFFKQLTPQQLEKMKKEINFMEQQEMGIGLSGALQFLREKNALMQQQQVGRANDRTSNHNKPGDRVILQYRNASGKLMKPKQAFRYLSAKFHGQGPSKNKVQKIKKKQLLQMKIKQAANGPSKMMTLLQKHQSKTGEAHMVIQLGAKNKQSE